MYSSITWIVLSKEGRRMTENIGVFCFVLIFYIIHQSKIFSNVRMGRPVEPVLSSAVDYYPACKVDKALKTWSWLFVVPQ